MGYRNDALTTLIGYTTASLNILYFELEFNNNELELITSSRGLYIVHDALSWFITDSVVLMIIVVTTEMYIFQHLDEFGILKYMKEREMVEENLIFVMSICAIMQQILNTLAQVVWSKNEYDVVASVKYVSMGVDFMTVACLIVYVIRASHRNFELFKSLLPGYEARRKVELEEEFANYPRNKMSKLGRQWRRPLLRQEKAK
jgi:hypothetical protein